MAAWQRLVQEWQLLLMALQFLTRVPVPASLPHAPGRMAQAVRHFPLVGAGVGAFGAALAVLAHGLWPASVAAAIAVAGTVWLTAAFHEDGLADSFDALLGAASRDKALAIMQDPRIGSHGASALVLVLLLRVLLLAALLAQGPWIAAAALVAAHAAGRALAVLLMASLPYAREAREAREGAADAPAKAGSLARGVRVADAAWAVAVGAGVLALAAHSLPAPLPGLVISLLALLGLLLLLRRWLQRRLGGYTGDTLGAAEQFGELVVLLAFSASAGQWPG